MLEAEPVIIPECWYAIAEAKSVTGERPLGLVRLGRRLVLWRDAAGEVACLPAACPHRGADLSLGRVRAGELECRYHGFRFASSGACVATPCEGREARIPAGLDARALPVREAHGLLWMWHGAGAARGEPPWIADAPEPGPRHATWAEDWAIGFTRVMEGMQDLHHFPFAHRKIDPWRGRATRLDPFEFTIDGELLRQRAGLRRDEPGAEPVASFELAAVFPGLVYLRFGPRLDGSVVACPIDDEHTWVWACYRVRSGLGRVIDRLSSWLGLWSEFALVQPDDKRMLASSQPQRPTVHDSALVRADAQIAAWHKLRRARLRERISSDDADSTRAAARRVR
ncbi:MAG TPA: aromatic ring-hydroxylating dioxygenase subunit alpha [Enhygromyxa sp.]|nr:aromatic ring-hydroxylating dioxygenase subunit alpha [Enhygromyxa sp.]